MSKFPHCVRCVPWLCTFEVLSVARAAGHMWILSSVGLPVAKRFSACIRILMAGFSQLHEGPRRDTPATSWTTNRRSHKGPAIGPAIGLAFLRFLNLLGHGTIFISTFGFGMILGCFFGFSTQNHAESLWNYIKESFPDPKRAKFWWKDRIWTCPGVQDLSRTGPRRQALTAVSSSFFPRIMFLYYKANSCFLRKI